MLNQLIKIYSRALRKFSSIPAEKEN